VTDDRERTHPGSATTSASSIVERPPHALTVPAFKYLWLNNVAFFMASNAQRFVFAWFVLDGLDRAESDQGLIVFALGLPGIFLVLQAGAWADRWDRRRLLFGSQLASAVTMLAGMVYIATDQTSFPLLMGLAVVSGAAVAIGQPVRQALVPALVSPAQLFSAIALNAIAMTLSLILGNVFARLFGGLFGFGGAFGFLLALFLIGLLALVPLEVPPHVEIVARRSIWIETIEAMRQVFNEHAIRKLFALLMLAGLTINPLVMVTMQAHVKEALGRNSGDSALPFALMGVGIACTSFIVMRKGNMANKGAAFMRAMMVGSAVVALMGRTTALWQLALLGLTMGLAGGFYINMNQGLIQANTPQPLMGRVMALFTLVQIGMLPLGALMYGIIANNIGTGDTMTYGALIGLVLVTFTYFTDAKLRNLA